MKKLGLLILIGLLMLEGAALAGKSVDINFAGVTARSLAMGNASTAVAENAEAIFVNPATLAFSKEWSFTSMSTRLMQTVDYQLIGGTYNSNLGVIGLGYIGAQTPAGYYTTDQTSISNAPEMSYADRLFLFSYAAMLNDRVKVPRNMGELSLGVNLKYYQKGLSGGYTNSGTGFSSDLAFLLKPNENTRFGLNLQNVASAMNWSTGAAENVESAVRVGGAHTFNLFSQKVLVSADLNIGSLSNAPLTWHLGAEYKPLEMLALRAGYDQAAVSTASSAVGTAGNLTAGLGIQMAGVSFDYAYHQDSTLADNNCHYFSLSYAPALHNKETVAKTKITHESKLASQLPEIKYAKELDKGASASKGSAVVIDADLAKLMELKK